MFEAIKQYEDVWDKAASPKIIDNTLHVRLSNTMPIVGELTYHTPLPMPSTTASTLLESYRQSAEETRIKNEQRFIEVNAQALAAEEANNRRLCEEYSAKVRELNLPEDVAWTSEQITNIIKNREQRFPAAGIPSNISINKIEDKRANVCQMNSVTSEQIKIESIYGHDAYANLLMEDRKNGFNVDCTLASHINWKDYNATYSSFVQNSIYEDRSGNWWIYIGKGRVTPVTVASDPDGPMVALPPKPPMPERTTLTHTNNDFIGALYKPYFSPI